jgi:hypothetical protein
MPLSADEFLRRFLQHVLPRGFVRIRSFGLLANRQREQRLKHCRQLLGGTASISVAKAPEPILPPDTSRCQHCGGTLVCIAETSRPRCPDLVASTYSGRFFNSS